MNKKPTAPARGRPKKAPGESRDAILQVRLTGEERKMLDDAARMKSLDTSAWVRTEVLAIARRQLTDGC